MGPIVGLGEKYRALSAPRGPESPLRGLTATARNPLPHKGFNVAPGVGLEPTTNGLTVRCSAKLSYPGKLPVERSGGSEDTSAVS